MRYMRHRLRTALAVLGALAVNLCRADLLEGLKHHHLGHGDHRENQHHGAIEPRWSNGDGMANRFTCKGRPPGYYADMQLDCQVYHLCNRHGTGMAFECPGGTRFQQRTMVCDHWNQVKCKLSDQYYAANLRIGQKHLNFIDDGPTMQLVIRDDIDSRQDSNNGRSNGHVYINYAENSSQSNQAAPPAPAFSTQDQGTRQPVPSTAPPYPSPPLSHKDPRVRPDFMQIVFREAKEGNNVNTTPKRKRQKIGREVVAYSEQELLRETERDLKPWQRYFRNVFQQRGIQTRPHQKMLKQQVLPPPSQNSPQRLQRSKAQKTSPSRGAPFPSSRLAPASARGVNKDHRSRPLLPLGLVPPSHPITQALPASARILGISPAKVGHPHDHVQPKGQKAVMSLDAFLREFPKTEKLKTIPVEVSGHESDVVARLASGERSEELVAELDDLIATRAQRNVTQKTPAVSRHGVQGKSAVTVRPRGGNEPFFFSSDGGGLNDNLDGDVVAPRQFETTLLSPFVPTKGQRLQNDLQPQQRYHELSFVREPDLEFGFRPINDNPFFFPTEKPRRVKEHRNGRGNRDSHQHKRRHRHRGLESSIDAGLRDISAVAADAVRRVKATQFDMRNLFYIPPERGKWTRNSSGRKNVGHGFFTP